MLDKLFNFFRRAIASAERDRVDEKFDGVEEKLDRFDERMDRLEKSQSEQNAKLSQIHEVGLANLETLEAKLNRSESKNEAYQSVNNFRFESIQESFKRLEGLISRSLNN